MSTTTGRVLLPAPRCERWEEVLTPEALAFLEMLHETFEPRRQEILALRRERQRQLDRGVLPDFPAGSPASRAGGWRLPPPPPDLLDRRVEITGPVDRKMMIHALNSGARVYMADFEDATSPTWSNLVRGQANLMDAVRRTLRHTAPDGRTYTLDEKTATLVVRPRGWHLDERHVLVDGVPMSASLFDAGLFVFLNARGLLEAGSGPYLYLPKLEGAQEARLWGDVFAFTEGALGLRRGSIRVTVLIETITAAFEMDEILFELRDHATGLNAGRWDYIFSVIKRFREREAFLLPDRSQVTMEVPFLRAYARLLVETCHRRGAHAIGGMAAFIPSRRDPAVNEEAFRQVRRDKRREAAQGFDGTWVAHPDLVGVAQEAFDRRLGDAPHQIAWQGDGLGVTAGDLLDVRVPGGLITERGLRQNVRVGILYLASWLAGTGAVAIDNLMEDAATAEISRAQVWQWVRHGARLEDGRKVTPEGVSEVVQEELAGIRGRLPAGARSGLPFGEAAGLFEDVALGAPFAEFLTLPAYGRLVRGGTGA